MIRHRASKYILYPLYPPRTSWLEGLMVKFHFGGIARCTVCGSLTLLYVHSDNLRETCSCVKCRSTNRQRQLAYVSCEVLSAGTGLRLRSLRDFPKLNDFVVYNTEAQGAVHKLLRRMKHYLSSEYFGPDRKSGELVNGVMHQDLMNLSFPSESIDLVLSSDVFEHMPDPYKAHKEVFRVLKPGGRHIFTVPFYQTEFLDEDRTTLNEQGELAFLKDAWYHADPVRPEGALVYKVFSLEMLVKLKRIGFRTNMYRLFKPSRGILGSNAVVFEAIKEGG